MTIFLYWLCTMIIVATMIPLVVVISYLFRKKYEDGEAEELKKLILLVCLSKMAFLFFVMLNILSMGSHSLSVRLSIFIMAISIICFTDWWALFKIKKIIRYNG